MKYMFSVVVFALVVSSCGGGKSACDCAKEGMELAKKAMDDSQNAEKYLKEAEELKNGPCSKFTQEDYAKCLGK
jgi:hypothetical protein